MCAVSPVGDQMVYERFDVAQPEVVGEDESCTFLDVFG